MAWATHGPCSLTSALCCPAPCPAPREAALAWEAAFVQLASTRLAAMAEGAGLRLSFSTERSVQDELARESASGARSLNQLACVPVTRRRHECAVDCFPAHLPLSSGRVLS